MFAGMGAAAHDGSPPAAAAPTQSVLLAHAVAPPAHVHAVTPSAQRGSWSAGKAHTLSAASVRFFAGMHRYATSTLGSVLSQHPFMYVSHGGPIPDGDSVPYLRLTAPLAASSLWQRISSIHCGDIFAA